MSSKNVKSKSIIGDKYYTPADVVKHFMDNGWLKLNLKPKTILDPCCGLGMFKYVLKNYFTNDVQFTQFDNDPSSVAEEIIDYTKYTTSKKFDLVISNPPYTFAKEFVDNALSMSDDVVFLLRINFLGSQKREEFFNKHMPANIFVIPNRPDFTGGGGDSTEYAWFHFNNDQNEYTKLYRLPVMK